MPQLRVEHLQAGYGRSRVLHDLSFVVGEGEIVALLGRNGSGRSTTAKAIMGLVERQGSLQWDGHALQGLRSFEIAQRGIGYVPEGRDIFPALTVRQNLLLGQKHSVPTGRWSLQELFGLFPRLKEREHTAGGVLSGGEQQMLSLCRTLMGDPQLVILDEPTEGLSPQLVQQVAHLLQRLRQRGVSVLLIEQKLQLALDMADRVLVMGHGRLVFEGSPQALRKDAAIRREWLEV